MITMLEQKQIEEMSEDIARVLCEIYRPNCDEYQPHSCSKCYVNSTPIGCFVEMLYEAGYRKQSEWISVEERLPDICGMDVLMVAVNCYGQTNIVKGFTDYQCPIKFLTNEKQYDNIWGAWEVTHWMPLPEAPKGGAE